MNFYLTNKHVFFHIVCYLRSQSLSHLSLICVCQIFLPYQIYWPERDSMALTGIDLNTIVWHWQAPPLSQWFMGTSINAIQWFMGTSITAIQWFMGTSINAIQWWYKPISKKQKNPFLRNKQENRPFALPDITGSKSQDLGWQSHTTSTSARLTVTTSTSARLTVTTSTCTRLTDTRHQYKHQTDSHHQYKRQADTVRHQALQLLQYKFCIYM